MTNPRNRGSRVEGWLRYWSLIQYKTYAELKAESERTYIGYAWWAAEPVISMGVYYVVFEWILDRGTPDYVPFLLVGLVPWRWIATGITHGASSILLARSLMQQVHIPKVVFPLVSVLSDTCKFVVVLALLVAFVLLSGFPLSVHYLELPWLIVVQLLLISAVTLLVAGITPFLPDLRMVLESLVRLWMFLSGIFYAVEALPAGLASWIRLNPMTVIIASYRDILLRGEAPDHGRLALIALGSALLLLLAAKMIRRFDYHYPKLQM